MKLQLSKLLTCCKSKSTKLDHHDNGPLVAQVKLKQE